MMLLITTNQNYNRTIVTVRKTFAQFWGNHRQHDIVRSQRDTYDFKDIELINVFNINFT